MLQFCFASPSLRLNDSISPMTLWKAEYIAYLESKKSEKQAAIDSLIESSKMDMETFVAKKKVKELENEAKLEGAFKRNACLSVPVRSMAGHC